MCRPQWSRLWASRSYGGMIHSVFCCCWLGDLSTREATLQRPRGERIVHSAPLTQEETSPQGTTWRVKNQERLSRDCVAAGLGRLEERTTEKEKYFGMIVSWPQALCGAKSFACRSTGSGGDGDHRPQTRSMYRRYRIVDEKDHREATGLQPPSKTAENGHFRAIKG